MADFNGFVCDVCGQVWDNQLKTREKRSFTGFKPIGDFFQELCPECVIAPTTLTPVQTRRKKRKQEECSETLTTTPPLKPLSESGHTFPIVDLTQ